MSVFTQRSTPLSKNEKKKLFRLVQQKDETKNIHEKIKTLDEKLKHFSSNTNVQSFVCSLRGGGITIKPCDSKFIV